MSCHVWIINISKLDKLKRGILVVVVHLVDLLIRARQRRSGAHSEMFSLWNMHAKYMVHVQTKAERTSCIYSFGCFILLKASSAANYLSCYMNEWMNEWCIYIALYCVLLYTQSALQSCGGGGGLSSTTTSVQHPLGWCDGCHRTTAPVRSPHTRYRGERVIEPIKCMWDY